MSDQFNATLDKQREIFKKVSEIHKINNVAIALKRMRLSRCPELGRLDPNPPTGACISSSESEIKRMGRDVLNKINPGAQRQKPSVTTSAI